MAKLGDSFKQDSTFIFFDLYREGHPCLPSSPQAEIIGIGLYLVVGQGLTWANYLLLKSVKSKSKMSKKSSSIFFPNA